MLTALRHETPGCMTSCAETRAYRAAMCGVCHALGDGYGQLARLLTTHELILLNLLTSAQRAETPPTVMRRCPINPLRQVATNRDSGSALAAAAAVEIARASFADDAQDTGGRDLMARLAGRLLAAPGRVARRALAALDADPDLIERLTGWQTAVETTPDADPAQPTAAASAALFALTARLSGAPENEVALAGMGAVFGEAIYLADAVRDLDQDLRRGDFNPLRRFARLEKDDWAISAEGRDWLRARVAALRETLQGRLAAARFERHGDLLARLLTEPLTRLAAALDPASIIPRWVQLEVDPGGAGETPVQPGRRRAGSGHTSCCDGCADACATQPHTGTSCCDCCCAPCQCCGPSHQGSGSTCSCCGCCGDGNHCPCDCCANCCDGDCNPCN